jgi:hypothetical protein
VKGHGVPPAGLSADDKTRPGSNLFFFFSAFILKVKEHGVPPAGLSADDKTRLSKMTHHLKTFKTIMKHLTLNA